MPDAVRVGLAVSSHAGPTVTAEAKMSQVTVTGDVAAKGQFLWSEDSASRSSFCPKNSVNIPFHSLAA